MQHCKNSSWNNGISQNTCWSYHNKASLIDESIDSKSIQYIYQRKSAHGHRIYCVIGNKSAMILKKGEIRGENAAVQGIFPVGIMVEQRAGTARFPGTQQSA